MKRKGESKKALVSKILRKATGKVSHREVSSCTPIFSFIHFAVCLDEKSSFFSSSHGK